MLSTPFHPLIVHFPIALLIIGGILQIISTWKKDFIQKSAIWTILLGIVTAIIAFISGDGAESYARENHTLNHSMVEVHQTFGMTTIIVFSLIIVLKILNYFKPLKFIPYLNLVLAVIGMVTITITGHYGGEMVYQ